MVSSEGVEVTPLSPAGLLVVGPSYEEVLVDGAPYDVVLSGPSELIIDEDPLG